MILLSSVWLVLKTLLEMELEMQSRFVLEQVLESEWLQEITRILLLQLLNKLAFWMLIGNLTHKRLIQLSWKEKSSENLLEDWLLKEKEIMQYKLLEI